MVVRAAPPVWVLLLVACASSGTSSDGPSTVPVYANESEVPCRFEVIQRVEAEWSMSLPPAAGEQDRERRRLLGREGARAGADAVLLPQNRTAIGSTVAAVRPGQTTTIPVTFVGDAIRFLPDTCRDPG
jgi:hypothetical protein